jgi:hypothetical protein
VEGWAPVPFLPGGRASELRRRGALILHHGLVVVTSLRPSRQPHHPLRLLDLLRPHPSRVSDCRVTLFVNSMMSESNQIQGGGGTMKTELVAEPGWVQAG